MEHSGRWGRILEHYLNFAMKLLDPLTPMLIRGVAWGGGIISGAFMGNITDHTQSKLASC